MSLGQDRSEAVILATAWRALEDTVLSERCQTQRTQGVGFMDRSAQDRGLRDKVALGVRGWEGRLTADGI